MFRSGAEGTVQTERDEYAAHQIQDADPNPVRGLKDPGPPPGGPGRVVDGTQDARLVGDEIEDLAFVPDVISRSQDMDAQAEQFFRHLGGQSQSPGGVLTVGDAEVHPKIGQEAGKALSQDSPARLSDDVRDEQNPDDM